MQTCKRCEKGFCPSRVRRIYGKLNKDFCSPQCFSMDALSKEFNRTMDIAEKIFDELTVLNFIPDDLATSPDRAAEGIKAIAEILKGEKRA
jgi:hypothetical protein